MIRFASIRLPCRLFVERQTQTPISPAEFASQVIPLIHSALEQKAEFVCLPEDAFFMMQANDSETPNDGPVFRQLSDTAREHRIWLSAGLVLRDAGQRKFNSTTIFSPDGQCAGIYRKTHLTLLEKTKYGISPGDDLPVFDLPFGKLGVMTCSDILFPEVARVLALRGAQVILFPHQMAEPDERFFLTMLQSRAQDNCVPIVSSNFADEPGRGWFRNYIVGADGAVIADGPLGAGFTVADLDLSRRVHLRDYIEPGPIDLWQIHGQYRRPELYGDISKIAASRVSAPKRSAEAPAELCGAARSTGGKR